ncbi:MAG TPA: glycosyltransferase [Vicinamibacterales bacterium]
MIAERRPDLDRQQSLGPAMRVSLIVCTRNRAARLPDFLACLERLEAPPGGWELIVVDNASTDSTPGLLDRLTKGAPFPVRCIRAAAPGLSHARNMGLTQACGDILAFTDDDCYPQPDYLLALVDVFEEGRCGFVGGRVVLHDPSDARVGVRDTPTAIEIPPRSFVPAGLIHGANMAVTREVVRAIGEFDPLLGAGAPCVAGEDTDYIARAVWAGWNGRYDPRPLVSHHHGRKPGPDAERQRRGYDYGRGAYYMKRLLDTRSRRMYLSAWYWEARRHLERHQPGRFWREIAGAARYTLQHVTRSVLRPVSVRRRVADRRAASA